MNKKHIDYFDLSRIGRRTSNEDKTLCEVSGRRDDDNFVVLAAADGMGGLKAGDVASKTLYDVLIKLFHEGLSPNLQQQISSKLETYIKAANRSIYEWSRQKKGVQVGSTVSGAVVIGNRCLAFNVGDSRTYVINTGGIKQLTVDHSVDWQSYEAGHITKEAIGKGQLSNVLIRAVGTDPEVNVDIFPGFKLNNGDILFSCTDGLWNKVTDEEIKGVFDRNPVIEKALENLYDLAYKNGSTDNISMAAYRYGDSGAGPGVDIQEPPKIPKVPHPGKKETQKKESKKKEPQKINHIPKYLLILLIGLFLGVGVSIFFVLIRVYFEDDSASKINVNVKTVRQVIPIKKDTPGKDISRGDVQGPVSLGGVIRFRPDSGELSKNNKIELSIAEPLKSKRGEVIPADIYYTLDGSVPSKTNGTKYITGDPVIIAIDGEITVKAKVISRAGKYEGKPYARIYTLRKPIDKKPTGKTPGGTQTPGTQTPIDKGTTYTPPSNVKDPTKIQPGREIPVETKIETITNVDDLDQKNINGVLERIKKIEIDMSGITGVSKTGLIRIEISISPEGEARLVEILDFTAEPEAEFDKIKSTLYLGIQKIKFPPLTKDGKPVNAVLPVKFIEVKNLKGKITFKIL